MKRELNTVLNSIGKTYRPYIEKGARHYLEVSIGKQAAKLGLHALSEKYKHTCAIIPLKAPQRGMKVRIDGRTFVNYAECASGMAIPEFLAREAGQPYKPYVPNDSMICNFT